MYYVFINVTTFVSFAIQEWNVSIYVLTLERFSLAVFTKSSSSRGKFESREGVVQVNGDFELIEFKLVDSK